MVFRTAYTTTHWQYSRNSDIECTLPVHRMGEAVRRHLQPQARPRDGNRAYRPTLDT
jgi:hypothetical protein